MPSGSGGLNEPGGFIFDSASNLYVASRQTSEVLRYSEKSVLAFTVSLSAASDDDISVVYATTDLDPPFLLSAGMWTMCQPLAQSPSLLVKPAARS